VPRANGLDQLALEFRTGRHNDLAGPPVGVSLRLERVASVWCCGAPLSVQAWWCNFFPGPADQFSANPPLRQALTQASPRPCGAAAAASSSSASTGRPGAIQQPRPRRSHTRFSNCGFKLAAVLEHFEASLLLLTPRRRPPSVRSRSAPGKGAYRPVPETGCLGGSHPSSNRQLDRRSLPSGVGELSGGQPQPAQCGNLALAALAANWDSSSPKDWGERSGGYGSIKPSFRPAAQR